VRPEQFVQAVVAGTVIECGTNVLVDFCRGEQNRRPEFYVLNIVPRIVITASHVHPIGVEETFVHAESFFI
jgi:hypothetical protein